ncbi:hypothetical protein QN277_019449 [Acacia crassicarpa]|uniref:Sm domain-containing protein n=1 Tax=Acacia crassicarpa TaxID=499986 RepID=A0AAE1MRU3_9FABA|nr:hypothetical protein QN277_019449 [Acacia crassicarpa]
MNLDYKGSINKVTNRKDLFTAFLYLICGIAVTGTLKGYDQLRNLVLDEAVEFLRDPDDLLKTTDRTSSLGLIVGFLLCGSIIIT